MRPARSSNSFRSAGDSILVESVRYGPVVTFLIMALISGGIGYMIYSYLLADWAESNNQSRQLVLKKELDNRATELMLADEPQFRAEFKKIVDLYQEAKPLLPEETEVADVLGQVETAARRNNVNLTGLMAVKESIKSPRAEKLYEREIPAVVTGTYPQVVSFFADISRMPRILLVRDYSVASLRGSVSAGFTLIAFHAPPPAEMPAIPTDLAEEEKIVKEVARFNER
jgi:Tfp pilus assembly protein PilO